MSREEKRSDDFTVIDFIGSTMEKWLQNSFGVYSYAALAALSAETIEERLKADGKIPDRRKVEMWLTQAAALAQTAATPESEPVPIAEPQNRTEIRRPLNSGNGWQESAQFVVYIESRQRDGRTELQTTAHHIEGNAYHTWPGIAHRELCQWIVEQIENVVEEPADLSQEVPARTRHTRVEIEKFRLRQPARVIQLVDKSASQALPTQTIKNAEDSIFEVEFALSGEGAAHLVEQQPAYRAKTYMLNLQTGAQTQLSSSAPGKLDNSQTLFLAQIPAIEAPPGEYRLLCSVTILAENTQPDLIEVPKLRVL